MNLHTRLRDVLLSCLHDGPASGPAGRAGGLATRLIGLIFGAFAVAAHAQGSLEHELLPAASSLETNLVELGFENVGTSVVFGQSGPVLIAAMEYRVSRNLSAALCDELRRIDASAGTQFHRVVLILRHQDWPLSTLSYIRTEGTSCGGYGLDTSVFSGSPEAGMTGGFDVEDLPSSHSPAVDLVVRPQHRMELGFFDDPFKVQLALAPVASFALWRGSRISGQIILPVYNEFAEQHARIRPGLLTLNQFFALRGPVFISATAGSFTGRRFGVDIRSRAFFRRGLLWLGLDTGRTSGLHFPNGSIFFESDPRTTFLLRAGGFIQKYSLSSTLVGGRFVEGDLGIRYELVRQFRSTEIGFFASASSTGTNAGFHVTIPLLNTALVGGRFIRLRTPEALALGYSYRANGDVAEMYGTGAFLDEVLRLHHPLFLGRESATP